MGCDFGKSNQNKPKNKAEQHKAKKYFFPGIVLGFYEYIFGLAVWNQTIYISRYTYINGCKDLKNM